MIFERLSKRIRTLREARRLTQDQLAARCGLTRDRLSHYECGRRVPTAETLERIAGALGVEVSELVKNSDWLSREERVEHRRDSSRVSHEFARTFQYETPRDRDMSTRLRMAMVKHGDVVRRLLAEIRMRPDGLRSLRVLATAVAGSALEAVVHLGLLASGLIVSVAPEPLGFRRHPSVDPSTREAVGSQLVPGYRVDVGNLKCIFIPQVSLACRRGTWTVDFLCGVIEHGNVWWLYVEIDGDGHDFSPNPIRDEDLDMPCIRLSESEILSNDIVTLVARGFRQLRTAAA